MAERYANSQPTASGSHPPRVSGMKRAAQSSPARPFKFQSTESPRRMAPPTSRTTTYYPANTSGYVARKRSSFPFTQPLAPPHGQRPRLASKQAVREVTFSDSLTSNSPARRVMAASTTSAPIPVKTSRHPLPYWQITDNASARASDGRRVAAMSVGDRSVAASTDYRDISDKTYTYSNENVRKEFSLKDGPKYFGRKAARKTEEQASPSDDESMSESSSESSNSDEDWETVPESDKESESAKPDTPEDDSSDSSVEIIDMRPFKPPVIELLDDTPPASPVQTPRLSAPPEDIIAAIESLSLSVACMQESRRLPFLRRNLQRGFLKYCRARRVPTESDGQAPSIAVIFKLADSELPPHEASMSCYECPLCRLHSPFRTKAMLEIHLDRDHREVRTNWEEIDDKMHWRLELLFTSTGEDGEIPEFELITPEPRTSTPPESVVEPPPNPFGPTAKFPFLPAKSEYGGPDLEYSVRFSGPKIYDLLGTLPMEPYGILAWAVLDREEEIFESDDMPDEHKVMHALWARWIALRRNMFVAHFFNGARLFVDEYWKMIRLAAGWDALRYWLLMLMANRFLSGREVAELLRRYERWCNDEE